MEKWVHVLRIRAEHFEQRDFLIVEREPSDIIADALLDMPEGEIGGGSDWHIAAAERFAGSAVYFQIGRVQKINQPQYDEGTRKFFEAEGERAPYTEGVFDGETQTCVIERRPNVAAKAIEIAPKLEKLLNSTRAPAEAGVTIRVDELRDPTGFIDQIRESYRVTRFSFTAEFENAHDVYGLIHRPAEQYNEAIRGAKTTVESRGDDLDKEVVEEAARSAASVGDPASATVKPDKGGKLKTIYLRGTPLLELVELAEKAEAIKETMLAAAKRAYHRLRKPNDDT